MGGLSFWHILIVALLVLILFGRGKISDLMGDVAKGIKSFKKGLAEDDTSNESAKRLSAQQSPSAPEVKKEEQHTA